MAQAVGTSMAALCGASNAILDGRRSGILGSSLPQKSAPSARRIPAIIRASASNGDEAFQGRRSMLGLLAAAVAVGSAVQSSSANTEVVIKGAPPPSGGLPGTENSDQARDFDLPLKDRFFLQSLPPAEAAERAKDSAKDIVGVKSLIDKKAWPYVRNDLRSKAGYLRYDLNAIIASKPKELKKPLKDLTAKLFETIDKLDYAAREKSSEKANKYYVETVAALNDVLAKIA